MTDQALAIYGDDKQIEEAKRRLITMYFPGGKKLSENEARALAQISVTYGLNPMNGELWLLPSGPMVGIKGLRRKAREQLQNVKDGNFWTNFVPLGPKDCDALKIPTGALAFECRLFDTQTIATYVTTIKTLKDAGMPWETIMQIVGAQPYTSGYGYWKSGETTKMTPVQCSMKRAEADAIKRRFDIEFGKGVMVEAQEGAPDPDTIAGEWKEAEPATETTPEQRKADNAALFGEGDDAHPFKTDQMARDFDNPLPPQPADIGPAFDAPAPDAPTQKMWNRWYTLTGEARLLGVTFTELSNDVNAATLIEAGKALKSTCDAARAELAIAKMNGQTEEG